MSRSPILLVSAAVLVGGLTIGLWLLIGSAPAPAPDVVATPRPAPPAEPPAPAPTAARESPAPARTPRRPATGEPLVRTAPSRAPSVEAPAVPAAAPEDAGTPQQFRRLVSDQVRATEDALLECNDRAIAAGNKHDGMAAMGFTLTRRGDKVVAEPTTIEYSTINDPELIECMRMAARAITIDSLPEGATSVTAYRKVVLQNGSLTENRMSQLDVTSAP